ncbi:MAG: nitronate monooxygenase [Calditrichaeota bacterium]|nr:nitronate monooxygenase [Calditrichota bacterium]
MPSLEIGNLKIKLPIIQGGMGVGISLSGLASAVANQGGVGVIASVGISMIRPDVQTSYRKANIIGLVDEIRKAKSQTDGVIGVNIMVALTDFENLLLTSVDEGADLVLLGAGLPLKVPKLLTPERMREGKTKTIPIVSSARATELIFKSWAKHDCSPDAIVVEGPMAGGHLGFKKMQLGDPNYKLENLIPDVVEIVEPWQQRFGKSIPVIAAGGVYTGADILKYLQLGARGVQMATRFVPTFECDADVAFKQAFVDAKKDDMAIIQSPVGLPGRAIRNSFLNEVEAGEKKPFKCPYKCLRTCDYKTAPYCIAQALGNAQQGRLEDGFVFAGANAWRTTEITSAKSVFDALAEEYALARLLESKQQAASEELLQACA